MNDERRTRLRKFVEDLNIQLHELEDIASSEMESLRWTPRNLCGTAQAKTGKKAFDALQTAQMHINIAIEKIEEEIN